MAMTTPATDPRNLAAQDVRDLQQTVQEEMENSFRARPEKLFSRAAHLFLIDELSRQARRGLAVMLLTSLGLIAFICLTLTVELQMGVRLGIWVSMILSGLVVGFASLYAFRSGQSVVRKPLTWQANMTSCLSVVGTAFGAGAILLTPAGMAGQTATIICLALFGAGTLASLAFTHHRFSTMAIAIPSMALPTYAVATQGSGSIVWAGMLALSAFLLVLLNRQCTRQMVKARLSHPRQHVVDMQRQKVREDVGGAYNPYKMRRTHEADDLSATG